MSLTWVYVEDGWQISAREFLVHVWPEHAGLANVAVAYNHQLEIFHFGVVQVEWHFFFQSKLFRNYPSKNNSFLFCLFQSYYLKRRTNIFSRISSFPSILKITTLDLLWNLKLKIEKENKFQWKIKIVIKRNNVQLARNEKKVTIKNMKNQNKGL